VLLLTTREPGGRQSGHKAVLRTALRSVRDAGHEASVLVIGRAPVTEERTDGAPVVRRSLPGWSRVAWSALGAVARRRSFNEALYWSPRLAGHVRRHVEEGGFDVVVADGMRVAELALASGRPVVVDLVDLLSERYRSLTKDAAEGEAVLGYYGESLPGPARRLLGPVVARLLPFEVRRLDRREVDVARRAAAVGVIAEQEAATLASRSGAAVHVLPMAVPVPAVPAHPGGADADRFVFVGGLDYLPNRQALAWFRDEVLPRLGGGFRLAVIGSCPPGVEAGFAGGGIEILGYVDDLDAELRRCRGVLAPIVTGSGVKTKVLEAMAYGLPVVGTPLAFEGVGARPDREVLAGAGAEELAGHIRRLQGDGELADRLGAAGRSLVEERFAPELVGRRWMDVLEGALRR
jgi:hypothetical protein